MKTNPFIDKEKLGGEMNENMIENTSEMTDDMMMWNNDMARSMLTSQAHLLSSL